MCVKGLDYSLKNVIVFLLTQGVCQTDAHIVTLMTGDYRK